MREMELDFERTRDVPLPFEGRPDFTPGGILHDRLKNLARQRIDYAKRKLSNRGSRWREAEKNFRAYLDLENIDKQRRQKDDERTYPGFAPIIVPISYATVHTMLTYFMTVFGARRPIIQLDPVGPEDVKPAEALETVIAHNMDRVRLILSLYQWFQDCFVYGVGWLKTIWKTSFKKQVVLRPTGMLGLDGRPVMQRTIENMLVFEGNEPMVSDPYRTFHDPRVPVSKVQDGEFVCFIHRKSYHQLLEDERNGIYFNVRQVRERSLKAVGKDPASQSDVARMMEMPDLDAEQYIDHIDPGYPLIEEIWIKLIPADYGLSTEQYPEIWVITLANKETIIRAEPSGYIHGEFPVDGIECFLDVHSPLNQGMVELVQPMSELLSWLINSHMENVRSAVNNMFVVDPSRIEMEDMKAKGGKRIRLKPTAYGTDTRSAITQLPVTDITRNHIADAQVVLDLLQRITGVNDNFMGVPTVGKGRTATEVRGMQQLAGGRLKTMLEVISAMGFYPFASKCVMNTQQFLSRRRMYRLLGRLAKDPEAMQSIEVGPEDIIGAFDYPPVDGSFPVDKYAMAQAWKEIFQAIISVPPLLQVFDVVKVFEEGVKGLGIKNIEDFLLKPTSIQAQVMQQEQIDEKVRKGNVVPAQGRGTPAEFNALSSILGPMLGPRPGVQRRG